MYQIGAFSRIVSLTVKTLRYYDEAGILTPSCRDESNGYRLYNEEDYKRAKLIILLRGLDFSISETREVLENCENEGDMNCFLQEKKAQLSKRIMEYQCLVTTLESYISKTGEEEVLMSYEISMKTCAPLLAATVRYRGRYEDTGKYFGRLFGTVKSKACGAPFNCYYDGEYKEEDADIEVCVPVKEPVAGDGVTTKRFPGMKAVCTTHLGPYSTLAGAYKALTDYAAQNNLKLKTPSREIYLKGPGMLFRGNPNRYVTEIAIEIEE